MNLETDSISPQFHEVYDEVFETIYAALDKVPEVCNFLTTTSRAWVLDYESMFSAAGPPLQDDWLMDTKLKERSLE